MILNISKGIRKWY